MTCTAPIRGHRSARAAARCPVHGSDVGRATNYRVPRGLLPAPLRSQDEVGSTPVIASRSRSQIERTLVQAGLDAVTSHNFTGALIDVSAELSKEASKRSRPSHWLCQLLGDSADSMDPSSVAAAVGDVFADVLVRDGAPEWAASIVGWGVAQAASGPIAALLPGAQLSFGLRTLAVIACPDQSSCSERSRLTVPLLKGLLSASAAS